MQAVSELQTVVREESGIKKLKWRVEALASF